MAISAGIPLGLLINTVFCLQLAPLMMLMLDLGQLKLLAKNASKALFALPSTAGACKRIFSRESMLPANAVWLLLA